MIIDSTVYKDAAIVLQCMYDARIVSNYYVLSPFQRWAATSQTATQNNYKCFVEPHFPKMLLALLKHIALCGCAAYLETDTFGRLPDGNPVLVLKFMWVPIDHAHIQFKICTTNLI